MPFFDDSGVRSEEHRGALWSAFAILADQIERMVALNAGWSVQLVPMLLGLGFPELPAWLRILLLAYTGLALGPATGALYGLVARAADSELLSLELAREVLGELARSSLARLVPLYGILAWLGVLAWLLAGVRPALFGALAQLALLLLALCATYWGPLFAFRPDLPALGILRQSVGLVWRFPLRTLSMGLAMLFALALGAVSVGGMFLIVPVLVALMQVQLYRHVAPVSVHRDNGSGAHSIEVRDKILHHGSLSDDPHPGPPPRRGGG